MSIIRLKYFYKAYHLDRDGGIRNLELIEAMSDQDAIEQVKERGFDHQIELWDRTRLVGQVDSSAPHFATQATAAGRRPDLMDAQPEVA